MYGTEMEGAATFRKFTEYRLKNQAPSRFPIKTAFGEVRYYEDQTTSSNLKFA